MGILGYSCFYIGSVLRKGEAENVTREKYINAMNNNTNNAQSQFNQVSTADELVKFADLLQKGMITQEEYEEAKRRLLNA